MNRNKIDYTTAKTNFIKQPGFFSSGLYEVAGDGLFSNGRGENFVNQDFKGNITIKIGENDFAIQGCYFTKLTIEGSSNATLTIKDCTIDSLDLSYHQSGTLLLIDNKINVVIIENVSSPKPLKSLVELKKNTIEKFKVESVINYTINFNTGGHLKFLIICDSILDNLNLNEGGVIESLTIKNSKVNNFACNRTSFFNIKIEDSNSDTATYIKDSFVSANFELNNFESPNYFSIEFTEAEFKMNNLIISDCRFGQMIKLESTTSEISISVLQLFLNSKSTGDMYVEQIGMRNVIIKGTNPTNSAIVFKNARVNDFSITAFHNNSRLSLNNVCGIQKLNISNSSVGKTSFVNMDFQSITECNITHSLITEITYSFCKLPRNINGINSKDISSNHSITLLEETKETIRQLKQVSKTQGDTQNFLTYKSFEIELYRRIINISSKKSFSESLSLRIGNINSHGLDWVRPIKYLIISTLLISFLMVWSGNKNISICYFDISSETIQNSIREYSNVLDLFFQLLIPTRDIKKVSDSCSLVPNWFFLFLDISQRLIFAILAVQTVVAFQKFSESK